MSGSIELAFPGEPDYRDSPLLDAIRKAPCEAHRRLRDSWSMASDKALLQAATDSLLGSPEGAWRRCRMLYAGPGVWGCSPLILPWELT